MSINCSIPASLQKFTNNNKEISISASNIGDMIKEINNNYPGFQKQVMDDTNSIRRFLNIYLNDEDIRFLDQEKTTLNNGDKVTIITAVAGG